MNYKDFSLDELKDIAKTKGITVGNCGKDKLIEKIEKYDSENATTENLKANLSSDQSGSDSKNIVDDIKNIVSDLEDFEDKDQSNNTIADIGSEEEVECMSIVFGGLVYTSPITGATYKWHKVGDTEMLSMRELISMNNSKPVFLNRPWIILQDIRAINKFRLMSKYEEVLKINQLPKLFSAENIQAISSVIDSAIQTGMRDVIISKVRTMYNNGSLTNTHVIQLLEDKLKFEITE